MTTANSAHLQYLNKLEKTLKQLEWNNFPGIVGLVSKGFLFLIISNYFIFDYFKELHFKTDLNHQCLY